MIKNEEMNITEEERKKAEKILGGLNWIGDKESLIESIVKNRIRRTTRYYS